jgi:hypothetical protein
MELLKQIRSTAFPKDTILVVLVLFMSAALYGCGGPINFKLVDKHAVIKPGTLAVVSGNNTRFDAQLADMVTKKLRSQCALKVLSQAEIRERSKKSYPSDMVSVGGADLAQKPPSWFDVSDAARVAALQKRLKTDYLLVVWGSRLTKITEVGGMLTYMKYKYASDFYSRLFEFPSKRIVGYSVFRRTERAAPDSFLQDDKDPEKGVAQLIQVGANDIVDEFIKTTDTQRKAGDGE